VLMSGALGWSSSHRAQRSRVWVGLMQRRVISARVAAGRLLGVGPGFGWPTSRGTVSANPATMFGRGVERAPLRLGDAHYDPGS